MASTAGSEACLAVYFHTNSFSVSRALAARVTAPRLRVELRGPAAKVSWVTFMFGSDARLPGNSEWTQTAWNGTNDHE